MTALESPGVGLDRHISQQLRSPRVSSGQLAAHYNLFHDISTNVHTVGLYSLAPAWVPCKCRALPAHLVSFTPAALV